MIWGTNKKGLNIELSEYHLSHLMHVVQMCTLKRDSQNIEYYAGVFAK